MRFAPTAIYAAVLALIPTVACAQTAPQAAPEAAPSPVKEDAAAAPALVEVIVTAQRRSERLQNAGLAVDVVTGDDMVAKGLVTVADIGKMIPALNVQNGGGANVVFFLRGVGNFTVNGYSDPAIAFNYDGVYLGRPTSTSGMFYDLQRMEALKGPQGTLYGRNATAGAINVIPVYPKFGQTSGYLTGSFGNYQARNVQGAVNVPLGEEAALRVSGNIANRDGYLSDGTNDEDTKALRVQLAAELTPDLSLRVSTDYSHVGGKGAGSVYSAGFNYNPATRSYNHVDPGFAPDIGLLDPAAQAYRQTRFLGGPGRNAGPLFSDTYLDNTFHGINAQLEWTLPHGVLTIVPAWRKSELDNKFSVPAFIGYIQEKDKQSSLEARFAGNRVGMFDYILGGFYFDESVDGNYTFGQQASNAYQEFLSDTKSTAAFGRLTAHLNPRTRLIGGLRYTRDNKTFAGQADVLIERCTVMVAGRPSCPTVPLLPLTDSLTELPAPFVVPSLGGPPRPIGDTGAVLIRATTLNQSTLKNDKTTYRIGAEYDLAERSLLYTSLETGYRSGGFALAAGHETFEPEYIKAYTVGMKNRLLGNRLQVNLEAFYWKYRNQQVNHTGVDINGNQGQFTENVGSSINQGVEADLVFLAASNTLLSVTAQYLDAKYTDFRYQEPVGATPPVTGCAYQLSTAQAGRYDIDCSGKPGYQSPKLTVNMGIQQTLPLGDHKLVASLDTQYKSSRYVGFQFLPSQLVKANWRSNAQLSYGSDSGSWSITAFVQNIENDHSSTASQLYNAGASSTYIPAPPRTFGIRGTTKF